MINSQYHFTVWVLTYFKMCESKIFVDYYKLHVPTYSLMLFLKLFLYVFMKTCHRQGLN